MRNHDVQQTELFRAIVGALRATINDRGPVTPEFIGSAAKRVYGQIIGVIAMGDINIDATDTESGMGVYIPTGNTLEYTAIVPVPWVESGKGRVKITLHEQKHVSSDRLMEIRPYKIGELIDLKIPLGDDGDGRFGGLYAIKNISESNELTLVGISHYRPSDVSLEVLD